MNSKDRCDLDSLIDKAETEGMWLYNSWAQLWISPAEIRKANKRGRYLWKASRWRLLNPVKHLENMKAEEKRLTVKRLLFELKLAQQ